MATRAKTPPACPLSQSDCERLNAVLERTPQLIQLALKCQECGWDVEAATDALSQQLDIATRAKAAFFPNQP